MSSAFHLSFQAPPVPEQTEAEIAAAFDAEVAEFEANPQAIPYRYDESAPAPLKMSKGAKAVAAADGISDDDIREAIADPDELEPDPAGDGRMRLRRGSLRIVVARDGAVLSVRGGKSRRR